MRPSQFGTASFILSIKIIRENTGWYKKQYVVVFIGIVGYDYNIVKRTLNLLTKSKEDDTINVRGDHGWLQYVQRGL